MATARTGHYFDRAVGRTIGFGNRFSAVAADGRLRSAAPAVVAADFAVIAAVGPSRFAAAAAGRSLTCPASVDLDSLAGSSCPFAVVAEAEWGTAPAVS